MRLEERMQTANYCAFEVVHLHANWPQIIDTVCVVNHRDFFNALSIGRI